MGRGGDRQARPGGLALWKRAEQAAHEVAVPLGEGFRAAHRVLGHGLKHLGERFDIHTGGIANKFLTTAEIAQSEGRLATRSSVSDAWRVLTLTTQDGQSAATHRSAAAEKGLRPRLSVLP